MPVQVDNVGEEIQLTSQDEQFTTHVEDFLMNHHQHVIESSQKVKHFGRSKVGSA